MNQRMWLVVDVLVVIIGLALGIIAWEVLTGIAPLD